MARPSTRLQQSLMRNLTPKNSVNRWLMAALGAGVAMAVALILTLIAQSFVAGQISNLIDQATTGSFGALFNFALKQILIPSWLQLLALEHLVPLSLSANASGSSLGGDITFNLPMAGLLLIPAIALTIGGYVSAASDFQRVPLYSITRGALIAPFYAVLLAILAYFGTTTLTSSSSGGTVTFGPAVWQAFLYGLLWAAVFGALGGWIQLAGRTSLSGALPELQRRLGTSLGKARTAGALAGAVVTFVVGIAIVMVLLAASLSFLATNVASAPGAVSASGGLGNITVPGGGGAPSINSSSVVGLVLFLVLTFLPTLALYVFALATGATIDVHGVDLQTLGVSTTSYGLFTGTRLPLAPNVAHWVFLVALIPAISYLAGGRVAARVANARTVQDGFIAGAVMAVPASLLFTLAALILSIGIDIGGTGKSLTFGIGPSLGSIFLAVLIGAAVVGGLGGASTVSMAWLGNVPRLLLIPFRPLGVLVFRLADRLSGYPHRVPRSVARNWMYDGLLAALVLGIAAIALDIVNTTVARALPFLVLIRVDAIVAGALIAVPLLYFLGALVTAFSAPSQAAGVGAEQPLYGAPALPAWSATPYPTSPSMPAMPSLPPMPSVPYPPSVATPTNPPYANPYANPYATPLSAPLPGTPQQAHPWLSGPVGSPPQLEPPSANDDPTLPT